MIRTKLALAILVWLFFTAVAVSRASESDGTLDPDSSLARELDAYLTALVDRGFHGAVSLQDEGRVVLRKGYGWTDASRRYAITPQTLFYTASMAKTVTATAILGLCERGELSLANRLDRFFPKAPDEIAAITLHGLLTHTAGLRSKYAADGQRDRESAVRAVFAANPSLGPKTFFYTNDGYALLAAIAEVAAGTGFEALIEREILAVTGMEDTRFWGRFDDRDPARVAQKQTPLDDATRQPNWGYVGSGGIYTNLTDLSRLWRALSQEKFIGAHSLKTAWQAHLTRGDLGIGYGWFRTTLKDGHVMLWSRGTEDFGHGGLLQWYRHERLLAIVLTSSGKIDGDFGHRLVGDKIAALIAGK